MNITGASLHLANMIPSGCSLLDPSIEIIHSLLDRSRLPQTTIALAVCILDSLNSRFALTWRRTLPKQPASASSSHSVDKPPHIDTIRPEVVVLAALILAEKFIDDQEASTVYYIQVWGAADWTCGQINATQQCIMENLGYRLLPLWSEPLITDAMSDMERVGLQAQGKGWTRPRDQTANLAEVKERMENGSVVWWKENQDASTDTSVCNTLDSIHLENCTLEDTHIIDGREGPVRAFSCSLLAPIYEQ